MKNKQWRLIAVFVLLLGLAGCKLDEQEKSDDTVEVNLASQQLFGVKPTQIKTQKYVLADDPSERELHVFYDSQTAQKCAIFREWSDTTYAEDVGFSANSVPTRQPSEIKAIAASGKLDGFGMDFADAFGLFKGFDDLVFDDQSWQIWLKADPGFKPADVVYAQTETNDVANILRTFKDRKRLKKMTGPQLRDYWQTRLPHPQDVAGLDLDLTYQFPYTNDAALLAYVKKIVITANLPQNAEISLTGPSVGKATHTPETTILVKQGQIQDDVKTFWR